MGCLCGRLCGRSRRVFPPLVIAKSGKSTLASARSPDQAQDLDSFLREQKRADRASFERLQVAARERKCTALYCWMGTSPAAVAVHDVQVGGKHSVELLLLRDGKVLTERPPWATRLPRVAAIRYGMSAIAWPSYQLHGPSNSFHSPERPTISEMDVALALRYILSRSTCLCEALQSEGRFPNGERPEACLYMALQIVTLDILLEQTTANAFHIRPGRPLITSANCPTIFQKPLLLLVSIRRLLNELGGELMHPQLVSAILERQPTLERQHANLKVSRVGEICGLTESFVEQILNTRGFEVPLGTAAQALKTSLVMIGEIKLKDPRMVSLLYNDGFFCGEVCINIDATKATPEDVGRQACHALSLHGNSDGFYAFFATGERFVSIDQITDKCELYISSNAEKELALYPVSPAPLAYRHMLDFKVPLKEPLQVRGGVIPGPPPEPFFGNLRDFEMHTSLARWHASYGDVVRFTLLSTTCYSIRRASHALQVLRAPNKNVPETQVGGGRKGLFFADGDTHRLLREVLQPQFYKDMLLRMFPGLHERALAWLRAFAFQGDVCGEAVNVSDWAVRYFYDAMSVCGFGYRKQDFLSTAKPRMLWLFERILVEEVTIQKRQGAGLGWLSTLPTPFNRVYWRHVEEIDGLCDDILRSSEGDDHFLGAMRRAGFEIDMQKAQILNFFRAGTDTTAACLFWTILEISMHPSVEAEVLKEIDNILPHRGENTVTKEKLDDLHYLDQVIHEAMRLHPPANVLLRYLDNDLELKTPKGGVGCEDDVYVLPAGDRVFVDIVNLQRDPRWWPNPLTFDPGRFSTETRQAREPGSYIPFGGGPRTCIGNSLGMLEVKLLLTLLYQRYTFVPNGEPITVIPYEPHRPLSGMYMHLRRRTTYEPVDADAHQGPTSNGTESVNNCSKDTLKALRDVHVIQRIAIAFGSNQGFCSKLAGRLSSMLGEASLQPSPLDALSIDNFDGILIIIVPTYNGAPPNNAKMFCHALEAENLTCDRLKFAVFGAGNSNWPEFLKVPTQIDAKLAERGALRILPLASGDGYEGDDAIFRSFQAWSEILFEQLIATESLSSQPQINRTTSTSISFVKDDVITLGEGHDLSSGFETYVLQMREALDDSARVHQVCLAREDSKQSAYTSGDHFEILTCNGDEQVARLLRQIKADADSMSFKIGGVPICGLQPNTIYSIKDVLATKVELRVSRQCAESIVLHMNEGARKELPSHMTKQFEAKGYCWVMDVLDLFPSSHVDLLKLLQELPPLKCRYYSISSSPHVVNPSMLDLTVALHPDGLCSSQLCRAPLGTQLKARICSAPLRLRPGACLMICAGSGMAPFRAFLQERQGVDCTLLFGCRTHGDLLYRRELQSWQQHGLNLHVAYSREPGELRYVQDLILGPQRNEVQRIMKLGTVYVCGAASTMAKSVHAALIEVIGDEIPSPELWLTEQKKKGAYVLDVWG